MAWFLVLGGLALFIGLLVWTESLGKFFAGWIAATVVIGIICLVTGAPVGQAPFIGLICGLIFLTMPEGGLRGGHRF